jgi:citrate lyase beta subunit
MSLSVNIARRLIRSALFVPATSSSALAKAGTLGADAVILDLEQTSHGKKQEARSRVTKSLQTSPSIFPEALTVAVRLNLASSDASSSSSYNSSSSSTICEQTLDLEALKPSLDGGHIAALVLPRVERASQLESLRKNISNPNVKIWAMIETPRGVLNADAIGSVAAATGTSCLIAGTSDLKTLLRAQHVAGRLPLLTSLSMVVLSARANNLLCLDGAHLALSDEDGLRLSCQQGRELGFDGKSLIHPSQIEEANANFGPSMDEVTEAKELVKQWESQVNSENGVVVVNGRIVEALQYEEAMNLIRISEFIAKR